MPELPELQALAEGLHAATAGRAVAGATVHHPAALKTAEPPLEALVGRRVESVWRRGKVIGVGVEGDLALVVHLMQSGRLGLVPAGAGPGRPGRQAALDLELEGGESLRLRELSTRRRASAHLLDRDGLAAHRPLARLGPEPLGLEPEGWARALAGGGLLHSALRDGSRVAGIGRAYADDIMWAARLAPFGRADRLSEEEIARLARAAETVLGQALERARERISTELPTRDARLTVVHGHHGEPCLRCGTVLERVSFAEYELVYCPACQTGGRRYRDRRRSRFLGT